MIDCCACVCVRWRGWAHPLQSDSLPFTLPGCSAQPPLNVPHGWWESISCRKLGVHLFTSLLQTDHKGSLHPHLAPSVDILAPSVDILAAGSKKSSEGRRPRWSSITEPVSPPLDKSADQSLACVRRDSWGLQTSALFTLCFCPGLDSACFLLR